jgi:hypothetical protein
MRNVSDTGSDTRAHPPVTRAWHVIMANGGDQTVTAHLCRVLSGVLLFINYTPHDEANRVLVRAFSPNAWRDVDLVDTPHAAVIQLASAGHYDGHRGS